MKLASAKFSRTLGRQTGTRTFPGVPTFCFRQTCANSLSSNLSTYPSRHTTSQTLLPRSLSKLSVVRPKPSLFQVLKQPRSDSAELLQAQNRRVRVRAFPGSFNIRAPLPQSSRQLEVVKLELLPFRVLNKPRSASAERTQPLRLVSNFRQTPLNHPGYRPHFASPRSRGLRNKQAK